MHHQDYELLLSFLEKIKEEKTLIIVEGKKDKRALELRGIDINQIVLLGKPLFLVVEEIVQKIDEEHLPKRVVLLTDLDVEGRKLYSTLCQDLNTHGIQINNELRNFLSKNTKLKQIEGLTSYLSTLQH
ncbi:toprim domain-containing protein [Candidatus Woesearchaeota archaeon]|nr:toprim domain-containing protein [Candidatus Woesearchaeota archaeon]